MSELMKGISLINQQDNNSYGIVGEVIGNNKKYAVLGSLSCRLL